MYGEAVSIVTMACEVHSAPPSARCVPICDRNNLHRSYVEYQDLWMASDIEQKGASKLLIYFRPTGDARIDGAWERDLAQISGFPLRQVTLRTEVNEDGNSRVLRISRELTGVRTGQVPASLFVLPTGYKEVAAQETQCS
jgi:hypothetical protein